MTVLTPLAGLAALAALGVGAAVLVGRRRSEAVRHALGLPAPARRSAVRPALAVAGVALLGLAAAQPALTRTTRPQVRRDAQALVIVDTSRSMAAAPGPTSPTRLDRAVAAAVRLRDAIPEVETGILTLTDRVLPDLLPVADRDGFAAVAERAVQIESPPPQSASLRATRYGALADLATGNVFSSSAKRRLVVLLTDGESAPVQEADLARALPPTEGYRFEAVRFWHAGESVYDADGKPEPAYHPDPGGEATLRDLASALGGRSFDESQLAAAAAYLKHAAASGPTARATVVRQSRTTLAPYVALAGVVTLLAVLGLSFLGPPGVRSLRQ
jgi:Mg-chelatase subunit ChlD